MNRRSFLSRSMMTAASLGVGSALSFDRRGWGWLPSAEAQQALTPYPVLLIMVSGGMDPAMHMVAAPNGRFGNVTLANRLPGTSTFATTSTGIRYVTNTVLPAGRTDFQPHLNQLALVRAIRIASAITYHGQRASIWDGVAVNSGGMRFRKAPWASNLAAQFRSRGVIVPKPVSISYRGGDFVREPYLDHIKWATESPNPATRPDRILSYAGYFASAASTGFPSFARQTPSYSLIDTLDSTMPAATQPEMVQRFAAANGLANDVLKNALSAPPWPPPPSVLTALGLNPDSFDGRDGNPSVDALNPQAFALAFQSLSRNLAHVVAFENQGYYTPAGGWDSHTRNVERQINNGTRFWPALGKLLTLMKNTPSPIASGKTLFDTTNVWIQSEMGRTPNADPGMNATSSDGLGHWGHGSAMFIGGRFKRGVAIGGFTPDYTSMPFNFATGSAAGGAVANMNNVIATVMKAAGGDPSQWTDAAPIDALLDMSL